MYVCMNVVYLYVMYVYSESITTHHITQIISGAVPGKYLQANMDSLVKVILFVIEFILPCLLKTTIWIILLIDGFIMFFFCDREFRSLMRVMTPSKKNLIILSILLLADHFAPQIRSDKSHSLKKFQFKKTRISSFIYFIVLKILS